MQHTRPGRGRGLAAEVDDATAEVLQTPPLTAGEGVHPRHRLATLVRRRRRQLPARTHIGGIWGTNFCRRPQPDAYVTCRPMCIIL